MRKSLIVLGMLSVAVSYAQTGRVGINTETPNATLEVAGVPTNTSVLDGIIAPKITGNQLKAKTYTTSQTGALVYVTGAASKANQTGQTVNVARAGYYYFDGSVWQVFKAGDTDTGSVYLAGRGMLLDGNTFSRSGLEQTDTGGYRFVGSDVVVGNYAIDMNTMFMEGSGATGQAAITMGSSNIASGEYSLAMGYNNKATNTHGVALGNGNTASGMSSVVLGNMNEAEGMYSVAAGDKNKALGRASVAMGSANEASGNYTFAVGEGNVVSGLYSSILGFRNKNTSANYSLVAGRNNTNTNRDAFVVGNQNSNSAVLAGVLGWNNTSAGAYGLMAGRNNINEARDSFVVGYQNTNRGVSSAVVGENNIAEANYSFVGGANNTTKAETMYGIAIGRENATNYNFAVAMGNRNIANGVSSIALGNNNIVYNFGEIAMGNQNFNTDGDTYEADVTSPNAKQLFALGNGREGARSNALVVLRNGKTGIGIAPDYTTPANSKPTEMLDVNGNVRVRGAKTTITEGATCTNAGTITFGTDGNFYGCAGTTTLTWKKLHN